MIRLSVSTIIPVYNASQFIEKAVMSVLCIDVVKEVILIEDGSTDTSLEICRRLQREHHKIKLYMHHKNANRGRSASRNLGLEQASGDLISFLDADDYYLQHRFDLTFQLFKSNPEIDGVYEAIGTEYLSRNSKDIFLKLKPDAVLTMVNCKIAPELLFKCLVVEDNIGWFSLGGLTLRRKSVNDKFKFDTRLEQCEDADFIYDLSHRLLLMPGDLKEPVAIRGIHDSNGIFDAAIVQISRIRLYNKWMSKTRIGRWPKNVNKKFVQAAFLSEYGQQTHRRGLDKILRYVELFGKFSKNNLKNLWPLTSLTLYLFYLKITSLPKSFLK